MNAYDNWKTSDTAGEAAARFDAASEAYFDAAREMVVNDPEQLDELMFEATVGEFDIPALEIMTSHLTRADYNKQVFCALAEVVHVALCEAIDAKARALAEVLVTEAGEN